MFDIQTHLDNIVKSQRQEELNDSPQLLLGEIILKLETVKNKDLPLFIDIEDKRPMGIASWRGRYRELAIQTESFGAYQTDVVIHDFGDGNKCYKTVDIGKVTPTVLEWIKVLKKAQGKTFTGYKGGDFKMSKNTPVWLAEYGTTSIKCNNKYLEAYFVDVKEKTDKVYLITKTGESL